MTFKLYGARVSTCTRRVAVVAKELNVPYELIPVDIWNGEQHSEEHLARQPFAEVPVIEDDGIQLFESRAIGRYLVAKYGAGSGLVPDPKDIVATAKFEQAAAIENNNFNPIGGALVVELFWNPSNGIPTDPERVKCLVKTMERKLDPYEKILSGQKYLAGDELSLADLFHLPLRIRSSRANLDLISSRPNYKDISARPSWQAVKDAA
ncbi:glutathione S-transferase-like protein [Mycena polygramma]|nr:glutathione S-transferase-like protein [Mycena polygramma]